MQVTVNELIETIYRTPNLSIPIGLRCHR